MGLSGQSIQRRPSTELNTDSNTSKNKQLSVCTGNCFRHFRGVGFTVQLVNNLRKKNNESGEACKRKKKNRIDDCAGLFVRLACCWEKRVNAGE